MPSRFRWPGRLAVLLLLAVATPPPSVAFTPRTRAAIISRALTLMPPGLQRQLRKHARTLFRSALSEVALPPSTEEVPAAERLAREVTSAVEGIEQRRGFEELARHFGQASRAVADLAFALNAAEDPREDAIYLEFCTFVEERLPRMSVAFGGFADPSLARGEPEAFAREIEGRAGRDYASIMRSYFPEGRDRLPQDFDDRSVAFAAASLEVSLAVTATARIWLYAWRQANGDLSGTPTLSPEAVAAPFSARVLKSPALQGQEKK